MKHIKLILALLSLTILAACSSLEKGGAYAPAVVITDTGGVSTTNAVSAADKAFYATDAAFAASYAVADAISLWERDNRLVLWKITPDIKHGLDAIRPTVATVVKNYGVARNAYKANPTPAGLDLLQTILAKMKQLEAAASAVATNANLKSK